MNDESMELLDYYPEMTNIEYRKEIEKIFNHLTSGQQIRYFYIFIIEKLMLGKKERLKELKNLISARNLTYDQCAKAIGISTEAFIRKINGHDIFFCEEAVKMEKFLKMDRIEAMLTFCW